MSTHYRIEILDGDDCSLATVYDSRTLRASRTTVRDYFNDPEYPDAARALVIDENSGEIVDDFRKRS